MVSYPLTTTYWGGYTTVITGLSLVKHSPDLNFAISSTPPKPGTNRGSRWPERGWKENYWRLFQRENPTAAEISRGGQEPLQASTRFRVFSSPRIRFVFGTGNPRKPNSIARKYSQR